MFVTIAIPFYNAEKYLADSIRSVFAQTHQDWELILIDDGSTDGSLKIAQSIKDPRVRVISDGKNKKLAARLNEITNLAKYDYIARMDADDLMSPDRIKIQLDVFKNNPELDLVSTGVFSVKNDLTLVGARGGEFSNINFESLITKRTGIVHAAVIAKKEWYQRNKYDESLSIAQIFDLWYRSSYNKDLKAKTIAKYLYIYREENNVTPSKIIRAYKNERKMIKKYLKKGRFNLLLLSYLKSSIVMVLGYLRLMNWLQKRRKDKLIDQHLYDSYESIVKTVLNTPVNGMV